MLSVKQGGIKYHFFSLWYDLTWDWTQISRAISQISNHYANVRLKLTTLVEGDPKAPFSIATIPRCKEGRYSIPWIAPLYPWSYLIVLSAKQGGIKYHFLSLKYNSTEDWTPVSQTIGQHSTHSTNDL